MKNRAKRIYSPYNSPIAMAVENNAVIKFSVCAQNTKNNTPIPIQKNFPFLKFICPITLINYKCCNTLCSQAIPPPLTKWEEVEMAVAYPSKVAILKVCLPSSHRSFISSKYPEDVHFLHVTFPLSSKLRIPPHGQACRQYCLEVL